MIFKTPTVRALCKAVDAHLIQRKHGNATHSERSTLPPAEPPRDPGSDGVVEQGADIEYDLVVALRDTGQGKTLMPHQFWGWLSLGLCWTRKSSGRCWTICVCLESEGSLNRAEVP